MSLVVNHNMMAMNVARNLNAHYGNLSTSTQRLSSGLRINSAADDAAGLAVSELQRADIATLQQGSRNANDAISLIQVADGSLGIIDEKIIRMKELAEQAATGTYDSTQRLMIESEYQQMASEITRIANSTDFNGIKLLDGTLSALNQGGEYEGKIHRGDGMTSIGALKVHFGTSNDSAEDYYYIVIGDSTASALGIGNQAYYIDDATGRRELRDGGTVSTQEAAQKALNALNQAIISKDKIRAHLGAMQNRLENTISNLNIQAENLQAAESRIRDVDVATEMTEFTRQQILTQSAVAMLGQANSLPQMALQLIGG
ncbi:flagellin [uncultured Desulfovibrio sp.]|uniref:flagellin n=1 Tax=uncultured Desulfovibrio sp. TaxID=167968 RepID=UPI0026244CB3|nr:flagellin [uncultured Desulfovibrio sp.]